MFILYCLGAEVIMRLKKGLQGAKRGAARRVCSWVKSDGSGLACDTRSAMRSRVAGAYELSLVVLNNRLLPLISCLIFLAESRVFWMGSICQTSAQAKKTFPTQAVREKKLVLSLNIATVGHRLCRLRALQEADETELLIDFKKFPVLFEYFSHWF